MTEGRVAELGLEEPRRLHIVGIGGAGMSAIAVVLVGMGHQVSGSDLKDTPALARLRLLGVRTEVGHRPENLGPDVDAVVVSTAIRDDNAEVRAARDRGVPVLRRAALLRAIVATRRTIAVAGSHGKTTTSSMLALVLRAAGWRPSFVIGGEVNEVGTNAVHDRGEWLVVEADESDGTFLELEPEVAVVTSVEPDHLDHYGDFGSLVEAFASFLARVPGLRVVCVDDEASARLGRDAGAVTYGFAPDADYRIDEYEGTRTGCRFRLLGAGDLLGTIELPVPGRHNARNAAAAASTALELGAPFDAVTRALGSFGGVARRFQFRGEVDGITLIDDYAHLPAEVAAAIHTAREGGWPRVVAVFQPHRYTRTASLWRDFADAFTDADALVLTDVYSAGETPQPGISGRLVLRAVLDAHPQLPVTYLPRRADLVDGVLRLARPGDVVLTLGAGDLTTLPDEWVAFG
jgi:UDP-N-acetylmuramate--alanine ligase